MHALKCLAPGSRAGSDADNISAAAISGRSWLSELVAVKACDISFVADEKRGASFFENRAPIPGVVLAPLLACFERTHPATVGSTYLAAAGRCDFLGLNQKPAAKKPKPAR